MIRSNVRHIMARKAVTLRQVAAMTGLSNETLVRARGARIACCRLETLVVLARALGVQVKDLFEEVEA